MRICIVGDQHFRYQLPYSNALSDGRITEWGEVLKKIHETAKTCDAVVLMGDNFNSRHNHSSVNRAFIDFLNGFGEKDVFIISGNHERFGTETAIDFLKELDMPNWHVFTSFGQYKFKDKYFSFLPYMTPGSLGVGDLEASEEKVMDNIYGGDILFHHHVVTGTQIAGTTSEHLNEIVLHREGLEAKYKWVIGGHVHQAQRLSPKTYVVGNIFTHEVGEHGKSIFVLDTEKEGELEEVVLPVRGIYKIELNRTPADQALASIPNDSIVKCIVTDKQLDVERIREALERFDASIIVEQYPNERERIELSDRSALDLSINSLLHVYSDAKGVSYNDLIEALELVNSDDHSIRM